MYDETLTLTDRVADAGSVIETEDVFEVTGDAIRYLASHSLANAPDDEAGL